MIHESRYIQHHPAELYTAERSSERAEKPESAAAVHPLKPTLARHRIASAAALYLPLARSLTGAGAPVGWSDPGTDSAAPVPAAAYPPAVSSTAEDAKVSRFALAFIEYDSFIRPITSLSITSVPICALYANYLRHACVD